MGETVSNPTADKEEKIKHAAQLLKNSPNARSVFDFIYRGKKRFKTVEEIKASMKGFNGNTYKAAAKLAAEDVIDKKMDGASILYGKKDFYNHNKTTITKLSQNSNRLKSYATKRNPKIVGGTHTTTIKLLTKPQTEQLYIDRIDSFQAVKKLTALKKYNLSKTPERVINSGFCTILNASEKKDWGGERNDIFSNNITFKGKRKSASFALKGMATQGVLTQSKMGKNGDQIQRLFEGTADIHFVVYHSQIDERIIDQMQINATSKALREDRKIYYCIIDGNDLNRLVNAYPKEFKL